MSNDFSNESGEAFESKQESSLLPPSYFPIIIDDRMSFSPNVMKPEDEKPQEIEMMIASLNNDMKGVIRATRPKQMGKIFSELPSGLRHLVITDLMMPMEITEWVEGTKKTREVMDNYSGFKVITFNLIQDYITGRQLSMALGTGLEQHAIATRLQEFIGQLPDFIKEVNKGLGTKQVTVDLVKQLWIEGMKTGKIIGIFEKVYFQDIDNLQRILNMYITGKPTLSTEERFGYINPGFFAPRK